MLMAAKNEEATVVGAVGSALVEGDIVEEVVVIDDHSTGGTRAAVAAAGAAAAPAPAARPRARDSFLRLAISRYSLSRASAAGNYVLSSMVMKMGPYG